MTLIPPNRPQVGPDSFTQPFDMGSPPPELPAGSSNLPWFAELPETQTREVDVMQEPNAAWLQQIAQYPAEQQALMLAWWGRVWNRPSQYLDRNVPVLTLAGLLMHIEAASKLEAREQRGQEKQQREARSSSYLEWTAECQLRLQWIEEKKQEWDRRVGLAKVGKAQWDLFVEAARKDYKAAKAVPPPTRPTI